MVVQILTVSPADTTRGVGPAARRQEALPGPPLGVTCVRYYYGVIRPTMSGCSSSQAATASSSWP